MNYFDTFQKIPKNGEDWGKLFVAKGLEVSVKEVLRFEKSSLDFQ